MRNQPTDQARSRSASTTLAMLIVLAPPGLALAQAPAGPTAASKPPTSPAKADPAIDQLLEAHNQERAKEKLPALKLEARLAEAALLHAKDMAEHGKMAHEGSDESTPEQRVVNAGYRYLRTGENVAVGYKDVADVVLGWMESPGHRKNILGDYSEVGFARVLGPDEKPYWCADFGTPMPKFDRATAAKDLVERLNEGRKASKLAALDVDEALAKAAQERAADLAIKKSLGGGTANFDGIDQKPYSELALSTANGHPDAQTMAKVIFDSADLKAQVLGKFTRIGTGYAVSEDGIPYWCLILGNPAKAAKARPRR